MILHVYKVSSLNPGIFSEKVSSYSAVVVVVGLPGGGGGLPEKNYPVRLKNNISADSEQYV